MLTGELEQFRPDVICMSGYMHIVTDPLLSAYTVVSRLDVSQLPPREVRKLAGLNRLHRKFKGEHAVLDAFLDGEAETRSTVHIATAGKGTNQPMKQLIGYKI